MFSNRERRNWVWLVAGTGEGPSAAAELLALNVAVGVQVVTARACRAYGHLANHGALRCTAGALDPATVQATLQGDRRWLPPCLVVDATHPFAQRITAALQATCRVHGTPYLRLVRPLLHPGKAVLIDQPEQLRQPQLAERPLLAAIGARNLGRLMAFRQPRYTAARVLPTASALRLALAAGLPDHRIALLQPMAPAAALATTPACPAASLEAALCRQWNIQLVLARQSGGITEQGWQDACRSLGIELWLLRRPPEPMNCTCTLDHLQHRVREWLATLPDHPRCPSPPSLP